MGNTIWQQLTFDDFCALFGCGLTLVIESATLVRVLRGSRHTFVVKILAILIIANMANLASETVWMNELKTGESNKKDEINYGFLATGYFLFNVGHWMFAEKYFSMARKAPFKLAQTEVPRRILICNQITNWVFLSLNAIPPILFGVGLIGYHEAD